MKWSVALFGHYKYNYELREIEQTTVRLSKGVNYQNLELFEIVKINKTVGRFVERPDSYDDSKYFVYEITGNERRAKPGDIIALRPFDKANWTPTEKKHFLIVTIEGDLLPEKIPGITEPIWDLNSYPIKSADEIDWTLVNPDLKQLELYPEKHIKKRRFSLPLTTLESAAIDIDKMLDINTEHERSDKIFDKLQSFDKLNDRNILETDGLNTIQPVIYKKPLAFKIEK